MVTVVGSVAAIRSTATFALICHLICLRKICIQCLERNAQITAQSSGTPKPEINLLCEKCETTITSVALVIVDANVLPVSQFINYKIVSATQTHIDLNESFHFDANIRKTFNLIGIKAAPWNRRLDVRRMLFVYLLIYQIVYALESARSSVIRGQCYILSYYYLLHYSDEIMHQIVLHLHSIQRWCGEKPVCRASNTHSITHSPPSRHSHRIEQ